MAGTLNKGSLVKGTGGSGGGGSAKLPTIVTDSGSSLPVDLSGYSDGDTFLNTSDKKIYKAGADSYELNTNVTNTATIDYITGIASGFSATNYHTFAYVYNTTSDLAFWSGNKTYRVHFKLNSVPNDDKKYGIFGGETYSSYSSSGTKSFGFYVKNGQIYAKTHFAYQAESYDVTNIKILDYELSANIEYFLEIQKNSDGNCVAKLSVSGYDGTTLETKNFTLEDYYNANPTSKSFYYGRCMYDNRTDYDSSFSIGEIYLLDSSGEFLVPSSVLSWDSGTDLTDKTEYADKTNGALYLYENSELVKIGGSLTKKVYTISADNTSTLDVSSDFTKVVDVLKNGVELAITDDYTISSGVITFVTALSTTDKITVKGE